MRKGIFLLICILPVGVLGDELIINGEFNSGTSGWSSQIKYGTGRVTPCNTKYYSSPASCEVFSNALRPLHQNSWIIMYQTIKPSVSCTCRVQCQYAGYGIGYNGVYISLCINKKDSIVFKAGYPYGYLGEQLTWAQWERIYTNSDTISGIIFGSFTESPSSTEEDTAAFWLDDVSIRGTPVVGVEEKSCLPAGRQILKLGIRNNKIYLEIGDVREVELKVFDLCGRVREVIYSGVLAKGSYTFTPRTRVSGVYFVRLNSGKYNEVRKMVLMR